MARQSFIDKRKKRVFQEPLDYICRPSLPDFGSHYFDPYRILWFVFNGIEWEIDLPRSDPLEDPFIKAMRNLA